MKLYTLKRRQLIRRSPEETFEFFSKPENLALITPDSLRFQLLTPSPIAMKEGAVIDYVVHPFGIPLRWTTLITEYEPPHHFVDLQLRGPYAYWHHKHTFTGTDDGTLTADEIHYGLPMGAIASAIHTLAIRQQLKKIFDHRGIVLDRIFSRDASPETDIKITTENQA